MTAWLQHLPRVYGLYALAAGLLVLACVVAVAVLRAPARRGRHAGLPLRPDPERAALDRTVDQERMSMARLRGGVYPPQVAYMLAGPPDTPGGLTEPYRFHARDGQGTDKSGIAQRATGSLSGNESANARKPPAAITSVPGRGVPAGQSGNAAAQQYSLPAGGRAGTGHPAGHPTTAMWQRVQVGSLYRDGQPASLVPLAIAGPVPATSPQPALLKGWIVELLGAETTAGALAKICAQAGVA